MPSLCLSRDRILCCGLFKKKRRILKFQSKKSSKKLGDFGIVNIVQEATTTLSDDQPIVPSENATHQLAEQTSQMLDDIPPTRVNQTPVGERLIKSKIIPDQARALANALKHAVVNPLKRTIAKKKSFDSNMIESPLTSSYHQPMFSNPSSIIMETSDHQFNEISVDSYESAGLNLLTSPPAKPPRQNDETDSSSSADIHPLPPAKPPRHFSLYKNEPLNQQTDDVVKKVLNLADTYGIVSQDDTDMHILRQPSMGKFHTSDTLKNIQTFTVEPTRLPMNMDIPLSTKSFENEINPPMIIVSSVEQSAPVDPLTEEFIPEEIIRLASDLTENILQNIEENLRKLGQRTDDLQYDSLDTLDEQQTNETSRDNTPSFPHSIVTTHISPTHSTARPLTFVSFDKESPKPVSPLRDITTTKPTPLFTTSVKVISTQPTFVSSVTAVSNSDDELTTNITTLNNNLILDRSKTFQPIPKQNSLDSNDPLTNDSTIFLSQNTENASSARSLLSDYDNLHGFYGDVNDDNQATEIILSSSPPPLPLSSETISSTASSSMTTIYESLDNFSSSNTTSPSYISAVSTFNTGGTTTPAQTLNSDISDEEFIESFDIERLSQDNLEATTTTPQSALDIEATLAGKGEEPLPSLLLSSPEPSSLLISSSPFSSTFPFFPTSDITIRTSSKSSLKMPSKNPNIAFQPFDKSSSTVTNVTEDNPINDEKQASNMNTQSTTHQRRLPLPTKLTFEQNITNLIEKESPLLQSELLTAEHELSVLRSRLAVNEGVTAITGTILESLKGQFDSHHRVDSTTSPLDPPTHSFYQRSSAMQTSPTNEKLPNSLEIHYDADSPRSPYFVVKAINSFWIAQPIQSSDVQAHLKKFSSPVMKRATITLPDSFELDSDFDDAEEILQTKPKINDSISDEDNSVPIDPYEQLSEMRTIRSSSLFQRDDQFDRFDHIIDDIYSIIDYLKTNQLTSTILGNLQEHIYDLKNTIPALHLNKQDELRLEYELDELENLFNQTSKHDDYDLIELFEQNLNELQHLLEQIKTSDPHPQQDFISVFENKLESLQNIDDDTDQKSSPKQTHRRLIPENPVVTSDVFFEGDKTFKEKKSLPTHAPRLIPEDAQINASSFYEGDRTRSLYHHSDPRKDLEQHSPKKLIPEKPLVSSEVFYEGDQKRSMFLEQSIVNPSSPVSIENLRQIMSDLMLAASWSRKPLRLEKQQTKDEMEILAESFITTEEHHSKSSLCEITHEIENLPLSHPSILIQDQIMKIAHSTIDEEDELNTEDKISDMINIEKKSSNEDLPRPVSTDVTMIYVSPPSFEEDEVPESKSNEVDNQSSDTISNTTTSHQENDFHSDASTEYENRLRQTSNHIVEHILNEAHSQTSEQEQDESYQQTALRIVNDAIANALIKYNAELTESSISSSETEEESDGYLSSSSDDDEENERLIPEISDQPYLFVNDVVTSKSTQELGNLVQELQTLEYQIHSISVSENETIPQINRTKSVNELTNLVYELEDIEDQLEDRLKFKSPISSKSFNELGGLINELHTVSKQLNNRIQEEIFISTNIDSLSEDLVKYRRDSQSTTNDRSYYNKDERSLNGKMNTYFDQLENEAVQILVNSIIKEARDLMLKESLLNVKSVPTIIVDPQHESRQRAATVSISDDIDHSHSDYIEDKTFELAAQLDYLRRMSRYDNLSNQSEETSLDNENELKSPSYLNMAYEEESSTDEEKPKQMEISQDSITQPSSDSLDYHSTEVELDQSHQRLTASESSLHSTTSSIHTYDAHSASTSWLIEREESATLKNDNDKNVSITTTSPGLFDRVISFVNKPVAIVHEAMENLGRQRTHEVNENMTTFNDMSPIHHQHFHSTLDLHDEEKSKLVRSPELYNMDNVIKHNQKSLLTNSQIQYRTLSESALPIDDTKCHSLSATSNEASVEFLTAISKENSLESLQQQQQQQRLSTPFDDVIEKESSPEHSESYNLPASTFSDAVEPTSSCQRPLAFRLTGQQENITEEQYHLVANDLVNQVLNDVISELNAEQEDSSMSNVSEELSRSTTSSSSNDDDDDDDDKLVEEEEEEEYIQHQPVNENRYSITVESTDSPRSRATSRSSVSKVLRRAQTDARDFDISESPVSLIPPLIRRNSQSDTEVYFRTVTESINEYQDIDDYDDNSSSDEKSSIPKHTLTVRQNEKYSGEGEESSGGKEETITRRKRSTDLSNPHDISSTKNVSFKLELNDNSKRRESLDSPPQDSTEKSILKSLQERILRANLESFQTDLKSMNQNKEKFYEKIYSSITKKSLSSYDYDAGSETDRDDVKRLPLYSEINLHSTSKQTDCYNAQKFTSDTYRQDNPSVIQSNQMSSSIDLNMKNPLEKFHNSISDDLLTSISSDPSSSQSDATTVILNSNKNSMDDEENHEQNASKSNSDCNPKDKHYLGIRTSSSSASSSHSVIYHQQNQLSQMESNVTSVVNTKSKKQSSTPSFSNTESIGHSTKQKFRSYPSALGDTYIPSSPIISLPNDYYPMTTTSTTFQSGN